MVIRTLNGIFQKYGKFIFGAFAILIIMAFMPGLTELFTKSSGASTAGVANVFNENISMTEYHKHLDRIAISMGVRFGQSPDMVRSWVAKDAMQSLFMLKSAEKNGIRVSDDEIKSYILDGFAFKTDGKYDASKFNKYLQEHIVDAGYSKKDLDRGIKESLMVQKYQKMVSNLIIITDNELLSYFQTLNEEFSIKKLKVKIADYIEKVEYKPEELQAYFELEKKNYTMPARFKLELVKFEYNKYDALAVISEDMIKKNYDKNKEKYKIVNEDKTSKDVKYQTLESVKVNIINSLTKENSKVLAFKAAKMFENGLANQIEDIENGQYELFQSFTKTHGVNIIKVDWFDLTQNNVKGIGNEYQVMQAVSKIPSNTPLSKTISGNLGAYVIFLTDRESVKQATFEQVKDKVTSDFKNSKAKVLAQARAKELVLNISSELETGKEFSKINGNEKFTKINSFTRKTLSPYSTIDAQNVLKLAEETIPNEISKTEDVVDGTIAIYIEKKVLPTVESFNKEKEALEKEYKKIKKNAIWSGINNWIQANSKSKI